MSGAARITTISLCAFWVVLSGLVPEPARAGGTDGADPGAQVFSFIAQPSAAPAVAAAPQPRSDTPRAQKLASTVVVPQSADDRDNAKYTPWTTFQHQSLAEILNTINTGSVRMVDFTVETDSNPLKYTVVYVNNTGAYYKPWWFIAGVTPAALLTFVNANNARVVVAKVYADPAPGGDVLYYATLVSNTGADSKTWSFLHNVSSTTVLNTAVNSNSRVTQLHSYVKNGVTLYNAVMIANSGADEVGWWMYVHLTQPEVSASLLANNARLVDLDIDPATGNYNVVMTSCVAGCPRYWWYSNVSLNVLMNVVTSFNARITDANSVPGCTDRCWSAILISNSLDLDVDGNGQADPLTDGLLVLRYLFGLRGTAMTAGALGPGATRPDPDIETHIQSLMP